MKEITRIHLAASPYNIEIDAKKELEKYIHAIERALGVDNETTREIEARMIELLAERGVTGDKVITGADVAALKERLGAPGEFSDEQDISTQTSPRRLMRDTQDGMIGGVLSGMAAYLKIDAVWLRLIAIVLGLVSFGTVAIVYIVLWLIVPVAKTATERLQMRGEQPTLEHIRQEAGSDTVDTPTANKPLVVVLRVLGAVLSLGAAAGALIATIFVVYGVSSMWLDSESSANSWLIVAFVLCVVSGALFVVLMGILAYMVGAWRATRGLIVAATAVTVLGLATFGTAVGIGTYGSSSYRHTIDANTQTVRQELPALQTLKELQIAATSAEVYYTVTTGDPYVVIESTQAANAPRSKVVIDKTDDTKNVLRVEGVKNQSACRNVLDFCDDRRTIVRVFGPALNMLTVDEGVTIAYEATVQDTLKVSVADSATVSLGGRIETLDANMKSSSALDAENAAVTTARVQLDQRGDVVFGVLQSLAIQAPVSCAADGASDVEYEHATNVTINETAIQRGASNTACVVIDADRIDE